MKSNDFFTAEELEMKQMLRNDVDFEGMEDAKARVWSRLELHMNEVSELDDDDLFFIAAAGHAEMPKDKDKNKLQ